MVQLASVLGAQVTVLFEAPLAASCCSDKSHVNVPIVAPLFAANRRCRQSNVTQIGTRCLQAFVLTNFSVCNLLPDVLHRLKMEIQEGGKCTGSENFSFTLNHCVCVKQ